MCTINVNYMTRTYNNFQEKQKARNISDEKMADIIVNKLAENERTEGTGKAYKTDAISPKDMTMEEYKKYIHDKISKIPMHPSHMNDFTSVNISESGFEAMKNNPEYEKWVLDELRTGFAYNNPWGGTGTHYVVLHFGATKQESHGESWYAGYQNGNGKKLYNEKTEKEDDKKALAEYLEKRRLEQELMQEMRTEEYFKQKEQREYWNNRQRVTASYEAYFHMTDNAL